MRANTILLLAIAPPLTVAILATVAAPLLTELPLPDLGRKSLWIPYWPCAPRTIDEGSSCSFSGPPDSVIENLDAVSGFLVRGDPVPPGITVSPVRHEVARTTGSVDWMGRHGVRVTVRDGADELQAARLYVDDRLVGEATRDNGRIVDREEESEATIEFFLPWIAPYTVKLVTEDRDQRVQSSSISVGRARTNPR